MNMAKMLWIIVLSVVFSSPINCQLGILHISNGVSSKEYCVVYNSALSHLPETLESALQNPLMNLVSSLLCEAPKVRQEAVRDRALVVSRGFCPFSQKALIAQDLGASALIISSTNTFITRPLVHEKIRIPVVVSRTQDILDAQRVFGTGPGMQAKLYAPRPSPFDSGVVVMLLISVITVALGGYWCGVCEGDRLCIGEPGRGGRDNKEDDGALSLHSPLAVAGFVAAICGMLVFTYFFHNVLMYVFIGVFCVGSANALYNCLDAVMDKMGCGSVQISNQNCNFSVRSLILAVACISVAAVWVVYRNEEQWIWVLQDLLGIAFCLYLMKNLSLSSFKICVILLSLLLVYDVFFVFITPFFTESGLSIMAEVALGPGASVNRKHDNVVQVFTERQEPSNKMPLMMLVPRFSGRAHILCGKQPFSFLGYGDILVPGLLVAYCSRFDVWINNSKKTYFVTCCIAYFLGMVVTFAAMELSGVGQPALLYLVPFTLIATALVAWRRGEMKQFWAGTVYEGRLDQTSIF